MTGIFFILLFYPFAFTPNTSRAEVGRGSIEARHLSITKSTSVLESEAESILITPNDDSPLLSECGRSERAPL